MSSEAPIKTCFLKGQLKNNDQEYLYFNLCEKNVDISHGVWHLCITNCCFDMKETNGVFCGVSCNLIKELKFSDSNEIQSYFPSIACFFLKGQKVPGSTHAKPRKMCPKEKRFQSILKKKKLSVESQITDQNNEF